MHALLKVLGWLLLGPGALLLLLVPVAALTDGAKAVPGLLMLGGMFGIPGGLLLRAGIKNQRANERQTQMAGFVRSHDAFSLDELAAHIGMAPAEAQTLLNQDIVKHHLPLVMHRSSGRYLRLDRLSQSARVAERCQSCGGSLGNQIVFEGERLTCPYCSSIVETHAPAQAGWQHAQGAWGQPQQPQPQPYHHQQPPPAQPGGWGRPPGM